MTAVPGLALPHAPATLPERMSVSTLLQMEECPRQWALQRADYAALWNGRGYPPRPQVRALEGRVVHDALRVILGALVDAGCTSLDDPRVADALRSRGGLSAILETCVARILGELQANPRATHIAQDLARRLRAAVPKLRGTVQTLLQHVRLPQRDAAPPNENVRTAGILPPGIYREIALDLPDLGWRGTLDLLTIDDDDGCDIVDFKSGEAKPEHAFQLQVYALLWREATNCNPARRRATRLTLAYSGTTETVPAPSDAELDGLARELRARSAAARAAVAEQPAEARLDRERCSRCDVRHLCDAYWPALRPTSAEPYMDVVLCLEQRLSSTAWRATVLHGSATLGLAVCMSFQRESGAYAGLYAGMRLRVLGAKVSADEDNASEPVLTLTALSEVYVEHS